MLVRPEKLREAEHWRVRATGRVQAWKIVKASVVPIGDGKRIRLLLLEPRRFIGLAAHHHLPPWSRRCDRDRVRAPSGRVTLISSLCPAYWPVARTLRQFANSRSSPDYREPPSRAVARVPRACGEMRLACSFRRSGARAPPSLAPKECQIIGRPWAF